MDDLLQEFLCETAESLNELDIKLLALEQDHSDNDVIRDIFRILHTIKGTCGFLGLSRMESVAHSSETLLSKMRDQELDFTPEIGNALFEALDYLRTIIDTVENGKDVTDKTTDKALTDKLLAFVKKENAAVDDLQSFFEAIPGLDLETLGDDVKAPEIKHESTLPIQDIIKNKNAKGLEKEKIVETKAAEKSTPIESIRVNVEVLDSLITLVSELVLTRNQLLQLFSRSQDQTIDVALSRLSFITTELQEDVMKTRMQPIEHAWTKFPRLIHDLSKDLGKKIILNQIGGTTEVDRQVLELIKDPLIHMIRNACGHGLESPSDRIANGKNDHGVINLTAYHEGGHIILELEDDGWGVFPDKIAKKAIEKGLFTENEIEKMSDHEIQNIIFMAGFSTATSVTNVSGRGVGMDVVKSNIEKLSGSINMVSVPYKGAKFIIKIPITLTIMSAIIIDSNGEHFAIPQLSVTELHRIGGRSQYYIEFINNTPLMRLRQELLPLLFLSKSLGLSSLPVRDWENQEKYVVVVHVGNTAFGIVVDHIYDTQEIVVKPLARIIEKIKVFSGSTILGNGSIAMILDPNVLSNFVSSPEIKQNSHEKDIKTLKSTSEKTLLLIFKSDDKLYALPLSLLSRIGEVNYKDIALISNVLMSQYQNYLLPLIMFNGAQQLPQKIDTDGIDEQMLPVLIFSDNNRVVGVIIDEIITIKEEKIEIQVSSKKEGLLGSTIMSGQTVSIIDIEYHLKRVYPDWFDHVQVESLGKKNKMRALLVDDSQFFRHLISPIIYLAGFDVVNAKTAEDALEKLKKDHDFDVIISDIEMPGMNGYEFCKMLREQEYFKHPLPIIALSSKADDNYLDISKDAGFDQFIGKSQQKEIIQVLHKIKAGQFKQENL